MESQQLNWIANFNRGIADDADTVFRLTYDQSQSAR